MVGPHAARAALTGVPDRGAATRADIAAVLDRQPRTHGRAAAFRVLDFADEGGQSPGETLSRLAMHRASLPAPVLQWPVPGTSYRCDFAWPARSIVGEFDGRTKYGRATGPDADPAAAAEAVWQEKRREDRIRATGLTVVRWVWAEIGDPGADGMVTTLGRLLVPAP